MKKFYLMMVMLLVAVLVFGTMASASAGSKYQLQWRIVCPYATLIRDSYKPGWYTFDGFMGKDSCKVLFRIGGPTKQASDNGDEPPIRITPEPEPLPTKDLWPIPRITPQPIDPPPGPGE